MTLFTGTRRIQYNRQQTVTLAKHLVCDIAKSTNLIISKNKTYKNINLPCKGDGTLLQRKREFPSNFGAVMLSDKKNVCNTIQNNAI